MQTTGYLPLQSLGKCSPNFLGGFCKWWYTPIENLNGFPAISPISQQLTTAPALKAGKSWYGPVNVPDRERGWKQTAEKAKPGIYYKNTVQGNIPGNDSNNHINLTNLIHHQVCVVGLLRAGGFLVCIGNDQTGMDLDYEETSGLGNNETPGSKLVFSWDGGEALVVPSFSGISSMLPPVSSGIYTPGNGMSETETLIYVATGTEGNTISLPDLSGKAILLFAKESQWLTVVNHAPASPREVQRSGNNFIFSDALNEYEEIKALYK